MRKRWNATVSYRELTTILTTVGLPDTSTYTTIELVSCLVTPPPVPTDQKVGSSNLFGRALCEASIHRPRLHQRPSVAQ